MKSTLPETITALLDAEEKVLWSAQPPPYVFMLRGLPNIAYGVTWSVLGAVWYRGAGGIGHDSVWEGWWRITPLLSFPFILAGFSFFLYPMRLGARARRTWYVVTDRRAFIAECFGDRAPSLRLFRPDELAALQRVARPGGLQDLIFSSSAAENPHLKPRLEDGFFGLRIEDKAAEKIQEMSREWNHFEQPTSLKRVSP